MPKILDDMEELAQVEDYGKIIAKGRRRDAQAFQEHGYEVEAVVPQMFGPDQDGVFLGKYLTEARALDQSKGLARAVLEKAGQESVPPGELSSSPPPDLPPGFSVREGEPRDVQDLARCYDSVFESYPFPIDDPDHLLMEMDGGTAFFPVWEKGTLVAASSMEDGGAPGAVEMTDFATLPSHRGQGLATHLLDLMDRTARAHGHRVAYTIARAVSFGMNITFSRCGYAFGGTLINNTQIGGAIESMNVWHKLLHPGALHA